MAITNYTKNLAILLLGGSALNTGSQNYANYFQIGAGSSIVSASQTTLISGLSRQELTSSTYPATQTITFQGDWTSVPLSGLTIQEFGICGSNPTITGSMFSRSVFEGVTFDGTSEMRILETWTVT